MIEGAFKTLSAIALKKGWDNDMHGKASLTAGSSGMGGNQTWTGKMHGAVVILADADKRVIDRRLSFGYTGEQADDYRDKDREKYLQDARETRKRQLRAMIEFRAIL